MTELTRRHILAGAAAIAMAPLSSAQAAAPMAGKQAAGIYRYKVGSFECTSINDGARSFPMPDTFVKNVPKEQALAAAEAAHMPKGMVTVPFNPQLINTGSKLVLIDCGTGEATLTATKGAIGRTLTNLSAAGVDRKSIDIVLMSHLHPDHTNGIRAADGSMAFPNAEIKVPAVDWAFWMSDENMAKAPEGFFKASFGFNRKIFGDIKTRVTIYQWGSEVAPGITAVETAGHTPGHTSFVIQSGSSKLFFQADVTNVPDLFLRNPTGQVMFDSEPEKAVATRKRVYDMAVAEKMFIAGYHFQFPRLGWVEKAGIGYRLVPAPWNPVL